MSQSMSRDELRGEEEAGREGEGRVLTIKDSLSWQAWVGWRKAGQGRRERRREKTALTKETDGRKVGRFSKSRLRGALNADSSDAVSHDHSQATRWIGS
jgi:hypothetical protein